MFKALLDWWNYRQGWVAIGKLLHDPTFGPILMHIRETLSDSAKGLGKYTTADYKLQLLKQIMNEMLKIYDANNPIMANREYLCNWAIDMACFGVFILPAPPTEDPTGLRGKPGISGCLRPHIYDLFQRDENLKKFAWGLNIKEVKDLYDKSLFEYWRAGLRVACANYMRIALNDYHLDDRKDWFRPYIESLYAWHESIYREELGMENILIKETNDAYAALKFSTFTNMIMECEQDPYYKWLKEFKPELIDENLRDTGTPY